MNVEQLLLEGRTVRIPTPDGDLHGELILPPQALALVLFGHGSGSCLQPLRKAEKSTFTAIACWAGSIF